MKTVAVISHHRRFAVDAAYESRANIQRSGVLRSCHQSRLQGLLQLLQRRKHCSLGSAQSDTSQVRKHLTSVW